MADHTCTKCKAAVPDAEQLDPFAAKYPVCGKCWNEWKEYRVMVMNEMRLDMSMPDHRKLLKKHEKIFAGVMSPDGEVIDYTNEDNRTPDQPPPGSGGGDGSGGAGAGSDSNSNNNSSSSAG